MSSLSSASSFSSSAFSSSSSPTTSPSFSSSKSSTSPSPSSSSSSSKSSTSSSPSSATSSSSSSSKSSTSSLPPSSSSSSVFCSFAKLSLSPTKAPFPRALVSSARTSFSFSAVFLGSTAQLQISKRSTANRTAKTTENHRVFIVFWRSRLPESFWMFDCHKSRI